MFQLPSRLSFNLACVFISSVAVSLISYPEIFLTFRTSFMLFYDYPLEYFNTSIISSFMAQGGIQLWDHFGQMPFAYLFTTLGTFKFPNVITACVFFVLSPFSDHTGALFNHVFAWVNLFTLLFLRVIGIFLLLHHFIKDKRIIWAATVISSVFYCQPAFLIGTFYQSFYPIVFYLIIAFLTRFEWKYFVATFCFFVISFSNSLIHSCYMYMGVHFFILSALAWSFICCRREWTSLKIARGFWRTILLMIITAAVIIGPYVWMQRIGAADVEFDAGNSRLGKMLSIDYYFHGAHFHQADTSELFRRMLDFTNDAGESFFFGLMILALTIFGAVLSRDSRKWIFVSAILLVYLVNFPRDGINVGTPVHWLNALTNPFKSILRSYHMASHCVLEYLFIPLAVMGFEEMFLIFTGKKEAPVQKLAIAWGLVSIFVAVSFFYMPDIVKIYLGISWVLFTMICLKATFNTKSAWGKVLCVALVLLVLTDIVLVCYQTKSMLNTYYKRQPYQTVSLADQGGLGVDLGNPLIFPLNAYGVAYFAYADVLIGPLVGQPQNYFKFTSFMLNFIPIDGHNPRHKSYASWVKDRELAEYIRSNHRMIFHAGYAVHAEDGMLGRIVGLGLADDVIMVDDPLDELSLPRVIPSGYKPNVKPAAPAQTYSGSLADGKVIRERERHPWLVISLPLPKDFPDHLATTFFSEDRYALRFLIKRKDGAWQECSPAQGEFVKDFSFDVQNFRKGMLTVAVSRENFSSAAEYILVYSPESGEGVKRVWNKQFDDLGLTYQAHKDGWLVVQYPYDAKWRIKVDGESVFYYRVNKSFMGFPLKQGEHQIELRYDPGSWLRMWLLTSVICATLGLILLLVMALRWENAYNRSVSNP